MAKLSRRDFLKLGAAISGSVLTTQIPGVHSLFAAGQRQHPNVIILLFDTMSALHLSLYGYKRATTPNLERFASQATVYHNHYSGGKFTSPGTASLLTGLYPWKHRALTGGSLIKRSLVDFNPYRLLGPEYFRFAFVQNRLADSLVGQFTKHVDQHLSPLTYSMAGSDMVVDRLLKNDRSLIWIVFEDYLNALSPYLPASSLFGYAKSIQAFRREQYYKSVQGYPNGVPVLANSSVGFTNEVVFSGATVHLDELQKQGKPFFAYIHFFSPHEPYKPHARYRKLFMDKYRPANKPRHGLAENFEYEDLLGKRTQYDRFIVNVDDEFGRLLDVLRANGTLENSYVIVTSDHGQLFERGDHGHQSPLLYEGVIRVPLLIHEPAQVSRRDVYAPTSNTDMLPTLLSVAGKEIPAGMEGRPLPGLGGGEDWQRSIYCMDGRSNSTFLPLKTCTLAIRKGNYKLICYLGYAGYDNRCELYDLEKDPDELNDLAISGSALTAQLKEELLTALQDAERKL